MSKHDNEHKSPSTLQPIVIVVGLILVATLLVSILKATPVEEEIAPAEAAKAEENIKPVAVAEVAPAAAAEDAAHVEKSGADVVKGGCAMCHATGMMNSPKIGDKAQWEPRIAQGYETLVKNAINGIRTMPAKGGNPALTDGEIAAAVAEMANQAGANFDPATLAK
jgi:cytochrome c5